MSNVPATSNAMAQSALMYKLIEEALRAAATAGTPLTISELNKYKTIATVRKSDWQARDITKRLQKLGHVIESDKDGLKAYTWNLSSPSFVLGKIVERRAARQPSEVSVTKPNATITSLSKVAQEIEFVMGGVVVIIGKNAKTGRMRIMIEEAE